jgi:small subunit ribosomal protein S8
MITDPIADLLSRIKNAQQREQTKVQVPASKMLVSIAQILKDEGFINNFELVDAEPQKTLEVELKYVNGVAAIRGLRRMSKPGIRRYIGYREVPQIMKGLGISILSTPKGIMTGKKARAEKVGGEYLCIVY